MYSYKNDTFGSTVYCTTESLCVPLDPANRHYQEVLDAIILEGSDCFDGDIPAELQAAADAKQFAQQLADYKIASERLAQYIVSVGRAEVIESQATGQQVWNEDTRAMVNVMHDVITVTAIAAVDATVEETSYDTDTATSTTSTITNPVITTDVAERAAAQTVVDATPQPVKDAA